MRRLKRPPLSLPTLKPTGKGGLLSAGHVTARTGDPQAKLTFTAYWNEPDVRGALYAFHGRVCAYCQCPLPHDDPGDVEHFRPKSFYWWLAYEFSNYFLSCGLCNRYYKREKFPMLPGAVQYAYQSRQQLDQEKYVLLHPEKDMVEDWIRVDFDDAKCPVETVANLPSEVLDRFNGTDKVFRFNKNVRRRKQRIAVVNRALELLVLALEGDQSKQGELQMLASRYQPYGFAVRCMLREKAPQLLPSPEEELLWFVAALFEELKDAVDELKLDPSDRENRRLRNEICWALAALWKDPPAGSPAQFEAWLQAGGWRDLVFGYYSKL
jgi:uncharacterized protein (TIGR02646 family)